MSQVLCQAESELAAEGMVQQGLLQRDQGGEFALVEGFEALGFGAESLKFADNFCLLRYKERFITAKKIIFS